MNRLIDKKNNLNLNLNFYQLRGNQTNTINKPYANVLSTLAKIFDVSGKPHALHLAKLRKNWYTGIDKFLSKNAYPRNISVVFKCIVKSDFLHEFDLSKLTIDLFQTIEKMKGKSFSNKEQFIGFFKKNHGRSISNEEIELLKKKVLFNPTRNILHLTVYDGSISHAIHLEKKAFLRIFNNLLPEIKFDDIHCHVGDIEKMKLDQVYVASLAKEWHLITPAEIHLKCIPAFFHRVSKNQVVLVLYVSTQQDLVFFKYDPKVDWLLEHLQKKYFSLQGVLKKIKFVLIEEADLEKIRLNSVILGETSTGNSFSSGGIKKSLLSELSKNKIDAKKEFAKISKKLKTK